MSEQEVRLVTKVEVVGWATPRPGLSLDELVANFHRDGVTVYEVDRDNNRVRVIDTEES